MQYAEQMLRWSRAQLLPSGFPVDGPGEFWRPIPGHPAHPYIANFRAAIGKPTDDESIAYWTYRGLLRDTIHACGGVLRSAETATAQIAIAQAYVDEHDLTGRADLAAPTGLGHPAVAEAYYDYANLVSWIRTVADRLRDPGRKPPIGLLESLDPAHPLAARVEAAAQSFVAFAHPERGLSNVSLHRLPLPGSGSGAAHLTPEGRVLLPIPDPPAEQVFIFDQFTWALDRDLATFCDAATRQVTELGDGILAAFAAEAAPWFAARARPDGPNTLSVNLS
jgi:hypothetical protein